MVVYVPATGVTTLALYEDLARRLVAQYTEAETRILADLQRRTDRWLTAPGPEGRLREQLTAIRSMRAAAEQIVAGTIDQATARDVIDTAAREGAAAAHARLDLARHLPARGPISSQHVEAVTAIQLDLTSRLAEVTQRILRFEQDAYQRLTAGLIPQVVLGTTGRLDAQREGVARFLQQGIPAFRDRAGRQWSVGGYVEMATRTGLQRAYTGANITTLQSAGVNLVSPIVGAAACRSCARWIGTILSTDGTSGDITIPDALTGAPTTIHIDATLTSAQNSGHFLGPNCRCHLDGYLPGLPTPAAATTYDPAAEKAVARQRTLERRLRADKRALTLTPTEDRQTELRARIRATQKDLRDHVTANNLPRKPNREQPVFQYGDGRPPRYPGDPTPTP